MDSKQLYGVLSTIYADILRQIPYAPNRRLTFEANAFDDRAAYERAMEQDNLRQQVFEYKQILYDYLTEQYHLYQKENPDTKLVNDSKARKQFVEEALIEAKSFLKRLVRYSINDKMLKDLTAALDLEQLIHASVEKLCSGLSLAGDDQPLLDTYHKNSELTKYRSIICREINANTALREVGEMDEARAHLIDKTNYFIVGALIDQLQANTAYCEEYTCLALKKIFERHDLPDDIVVEKVSIEYSYNGHTFLAINRLPNSDLKNPATWGEDAFLFDPWNQVLCWAKEFVNLDKQLQGYYHLRYEWSVDAVFKHADTSLLRNLVILNTCFQTTGMQEFQERIPMLMEEYQLTSLEKPALSQTKEFLYALLKTVKPAELTIPIKLYLTTSGNKYVSKLLGFPDASVAIHIDILNGIPDERFTIEELKFGLACELQHLINQGLGICDELQLTQQNKIDKAAFACCENGNAAISYLRKSHAFAKQAKDQKHVKLPSITYNYETHLKATYDQRIKNFMTLLGSARLVSVPNTLETKLPNGLIDELKPVKRQYYFKEGFDKQVSRFDKINYLITCLPELKRELLPYELTEQPSVRVLDYVALLKNLALDLSNPEEAKAANYLIKLAYHEQIPAFNRVYLGVLGRGDAAIDAKKLVPLGMFRQLQDEINSFLLATDAEQAEASAIKFFASYQHYKNLFTDTLTRSSALQHIWNYQWTHAQRTPTGRDRYFGSFLGGNVDFQGFVIPSNAKENELPWQSHLEWMKVKPNSKMAELLFLLGLNRVPAIWKQLTALQLFNFLDHPTKLKFVLDKKYSFPYHEVKLYEEIVMHISLMHVMVDMFTPTVDFELAYEQFYDANLLALITPGLGSHINIDNEVVNYLLKQFTRVATSGTEAEKTVVKSFFLGRKDRRDLNNLRHAFDSNKGCHDISPLSHYYQFVIHQRYKLTKFNLFTQAEVIKIIDKHHWRYDVMPPLDYIKVYRLSHTDINFACLTELINIIKLEDVTESMLQAGVFELLKYHIANFVNCTALSVEGIKLIKFYHECGVIFDRSAIRELLLKLGWTSENDKELSLISAFDLALIYRTYDSCFAFPTTLDQEKFETHLMHKINALDNNQEVVTVLETLLLEQKVFVLSPLSRIQFANTLMKRWMAAMLKEFGKDDGSNEYLLKLQKVVDRVCKTVGKRDTLALLSGLANGLETQRELSIYIGSKANPDKFGVTRGRAYQAEALGVLSKLSEFLGEDRNDLHQFLNFISAPINTESLDLFADYLIKHDKVHKFVRTISAKSYVSKESEKSDLKRYLALIYYMFWDRPLEERCAIIDYSIIPASKVVDEADYQKVYAEALEYISHKIFKHALVKGSDDEFALAFLKSYLESADKYQRSLMLSGLLVASNKGLSEQVAPTPSKILAMLCEHLGPAYIKFAQAIHSHPDTPEEIRRELDHVKGRANPPHRWDLLRLIMDVLPEELINDIAYVGEAVGSASYNHAIKVTLKSTGQPAVLLMQRENARKDALKGFKHLKTAIENCHHPRLASIRATLQSMLVEAQTMSDLEMDHAASKEQYAIAEQLYHHRTNLHGYAVNIFPAKLITSGKGYRIVDLIHGQEFNDLSMETLTDRKIKLIAAKAIFSLELSNILSGKRFDSDRHGNQLRININEADKTIDVGLYDFGEMALEDPCEFDIQQLAHVFSHIPLLLIKKISFSAALDTALSNQINIAVEGMLPTRYLMRVRKALLALQDFQKHLSNLDVMEILLQVLQSPTVNPIFGAALKRCIDIIKVAHGVYRASAWFVFGAPNQTDAEGAYSHANKRMKLS